MIVFFPLPPFTRLESYFCLLSAYNHERAIVTAFFRENLFIVSDRGYMYALAARNWLPITHKKKVLLEEMSHFWGLNFSYIKLINLLLGFSWYLRIHTCTHTHRPLNSACVLSSAVWKIRDIGDIGLYCKSIDENVQANSWLIQGIIKTHCVFLSFFSDQPLCFMTLS